MIQKIDILAQKISDTSKINEKFKKSIIEKIKVLKSKYANNSSNKTNKIYLIVNYLDIKIQSNLWWASTTKFSKRMDKILWKKDQNENFIESKQTQDLKIQKI